MNHRGACNCKTWQVSVSTAQALSSFNPRICDCEYCQAHPSAVISDPSMIIELMGAHGNLNVQRNGDRLASFYHCIHCGDLLAVGCTIDDRLRGAVNALLLDQKGSLGESTKIQPRLLSSTEKLSRWGKLWGNLRGVSSVQ
jgi:hypothetical protein